jgi:hypothetical protein
MKLKSNKPVRGEGLQAAPERASKKFRLWGIAHTAHHFIHCTANQGPEIGIIMTSFMNSQKNTSSNYFLLHSAAHFSSCQICYC